MPGDICEQMKGVGRAEPSVAGTGHPALIRGEVASEPSQTQGCDEQAEACRKPSLHMPVGHDTCAREAELNS